MSSYPPLREKGDIREYQLAPAPKEPPREALWQQYATPPTPVANQPSGGRARPPQDRPGPAWITILLLFGGAIALLFYSIKQGHMLGLISVPILLVPALHGVWRGGFRKLLMIPVIALAIWWILKAPTEYGPTVQQFLRSADSSLVNVLVAALAIPILAVGLGIIQMIRRRVIMPSAMLYRFDRFCGALVGLAEGTLVVLTICWTTIALAPKIREAAADQTTVPKNSIQSNILEGFLKIADEAQSPPIGEYVAKANFLDKVPTLKQKLEEWGDLAINKGTGAARSGPQLNQDSGSAIQQYEKNAQQRNEQYERLKKELPSSQNQQSP